MQRPARGRPALWALSRPCSIWTVDLAHLLRRFGLNVSFFTVSLGINPAYANEGFYMAELQQDERRVSQLFYEASTAGIHVEQRSVSSEELQVLRQGRAGQLGCTRMLRRPGATRAAYTHSSSSSSLPHTLSQVQSVQP